MRNDAVILDEHCKERAERSSWSFSQSYPRLTVSFIVRSEDQAADVGTKAEQHHLSYSIDRSGHRQKRSVFVASECTFHLDTGSVEEQQAQKQFRRVGECRMLSQQSVVLMMYGNVREELQMDVGFQLEERDEDGEDRELNQDALCDGSVGEACYHGCTQQE